MNPPMKTNIQIPANFASLTPSEKRDFYQAKVDALNQYYMANHLNMSQAQCNQAEDIMARYIRLSVALAPLEV